eukprot:Em0004g209a
MLEYSEQKVLGFSPAQVYEVVSDVNKYQQFLPWCQESTILRRDGNKAMAHLSIGFPPLTEAYTALVLMEPPWSLRTLSTDGRLFSHLENMWKFEAGKPVPTGPTCIVNFWVSMEFRNALFANLGSLVFSDVAKQMATAFEKRCGVLYGPDHLNTAPKHSGTVNPFRTPHKQ